MSRSFVLKRPDGTITGYLVVGQDSLWLRAEGIPADGGELTLLHGAGTQTRLALASTQQEQALRGGGGEITAAYALGGGRVLFATGEEALKLAARALTERAARSAAQHTKAARAEAAAGQRGRDADEEPPRNGLRQSDEEKRAGGNGAREETFAQRRWPPPPCVKGAHYADGRWLAFTERPADRRGEPPHCDAT